MASARCLHVCLLAALAAMATAQMTHDEEMRSEKMMRRQMSSQDIHLHVSSQGEMRKVPAEAAAAASVIEEQPRTRPSPETPYCNTYYPYGIENSNSCMQDSHKAIERKEDCIEAASKKNLSIGPATRINGSYAFEIDDDTENPDPFPKNCFVVNNTVYFNPTDSPQTNFTGTPICWTPIYLKGNLSVDSDAGCGGDYEPISNYTECKWAKECEWGGMHCEDSNFLFDDYSTGSAPRGCFQNALKCYGYNDRKAPLTDTTLIDKQAGVCRLKSWIYTGPDAAATINVHAR